MKKTEFKTTSDGPSSSNTARNGDDKLCYVHAVSPLRNDNPKGYEYFQCILQMKDKAQRAICFSPSKRKNFQDYDNAHSPIKISKYSQKQGDIIIGDRSKCDMVPPNALGFKHNPKLAVDSIVTLEEMVHLAHFQLVNTKASVSSIEPVKPHVIRKGEEIKQQKVIIRDSKAWRQLTLYGDDVDTLKLGESYVLHNLRMRLIKGNAVLNTTSAAPFKFEVIEPIKNLVNVPDSHFVESRMVGKISGLSKLKIKYLCLVCGKELQLDDDIGACKPCEIKFALNSVTTMWSLNLAIKDSVANEVYVLFFDNDLSHQLAQLLEFDLTTEKEVAKVLFSGNLPSIDVKFDAASKVVCGVSLA